MYGPDITAKELTRELTWAVQANYLRPIMIWGPPGLGKTRLTEQLAKANGLELNAIPTRLIAEAHIQADLGFVPTVEEALDGLPLEPWMFRGAQALTKRLGRRLPSPDGERDDLSASS